MLFFSPNTVITSVFISHFTFIVPSVLIYSDVIPKKSYALEESTISKLLSIAYSNNSSTLLSLSVKSFAKTQPILLLYKSISVAELIAQCTVYSLTELTYFISFKA